LKNILRKKLIITENMKRIFLLIVTLFAINGFELILSQTELALTLDEARQYAIEYNKMLQNANLAVDAAEKQLWETISSGLPRVDAAMDYTNFLGAQINIKFGENLPPTTIPFNPTSNLTLTVAQLVFNGSYWVGLQTARVMRDMTETSREKSTLEIREQVAMAYYSVLVTEKSVDIINQNLANIRDVYNKTKTMYKVGIAEITDVDQMTVQVSQLENAAKSLKRQVEMAYNLLRLQLGVTAETKITLTQSLEEIMTGLDHLTTLATPLELNKNIDYQLMNAQQLLSKKQVDMEVMSWLPSITGFYRNTQKILKPDFDMTPPNMIGLQMNVPIFASGARLASWDKAKINYETTLNNKALLTDQLLIQEKQLRYNLSSAMEQYASQKENVEVSKRVFDNLTMKYQQGLVSSLDLTTANSNFLQSETNYIAATMQLLQADLALNKLLNTL
jgi:outer membrane protein